MQVQCIPISVHFGWHHLYIIPVVVRSAVDLLTTIAGVGYPVQTHTTYITAEAFRVVGVSEGFQNLWGRERGGRSRRREGEEGEERKGGGWEVGQSRWREGQKRKRRFRARWLFIPSCVQSISKFWKGLSNKRKVLRAGVVSGCWWTSNDVYQSFVSDLCLHVTVMDEWAWLTTQHIWMLCRPYVVETDRPLIRQPTVSVSMVHWAAVGGQRHTYSA